MSLSSYFDPVTTHVSAPNSYTTEKTLMCSDSVAAPWTDVHNVSDWSHMSSVSEGTDVYVVALRNLDAVLAFYKAGSGDGLAWMISSNRNVTSSSQARGVPSFTFESHLHRFYNPHDAQLIEETDAASGATTTSLLLFDDGNNRNHCSADDGTTNATGCFSRAIEYSLDFREQTVTVVWQFEWEKLYGGEGSLVALEREDLFVHDGGSVTYVDRASDSNDDPYSRDGLYYVAFTVTERDSDYAAYAWIFEVDAAGQVVSEVLVPRDLWDGDKSGLYRATPYDSVGGELGASPFDADGAASPPGDGDGGGHDLSHPPRMAAV